MKHKITALLLAVALCAGLTFPAFAVASPTSGYCGVGMENGVEAVSWSYDTATCVPTVSCTVKTGDFRGAARERGIVLGRMLC